MDNDFQGTVGELLQFIFIVVMLMKCKARYKPEKVERKKLFRST